VVGCDNISLSEFACPALTTINIPRERIGQLVGEALMPDGEASALWGREMVIEPELIVRDSTGPPPDSRR
jgi:DNA-binding LacI/PurR family transcriptional regulator